MITVLASITIKEGCTDEFIAIFNANVPAVLGEDGCIEYYPAVDVDSGLPPQQLDPQTVTIVEKWESLEALHVHLKTPHMLNYMEEVAAIVVDVSFKILQPAK